MRSPRTVLTVLLLSVAQPGTAATHRGGPGWHDEKCVLYRQAWTHALARQGREGLGPAFLNAHRAFLDSNCTRRADVCARSPQERALADTLVVLSMNFGAASTFAPFYCR
jgi:hypothetical protein